MLLRHVFVCIAALGLLGCAEKGPPTGTVTGQVTIDGAPPAEPVRVQFVNSLIGQGASAVTGEDGSYELEQPLRVDEYTVYFEKIVDYSQGPVSTAQETLSTVPSEYRTENSSPLRKLVNEGPNTINLEVPGEDAG